MRLSEKKQDVKKRRTGTGRLATTQIAEENFRSKTTASRREIR
jgi:hypothetical protein